MTDLITAIEAEIKKGEALGSSCEPGCEGRCEVCPDDYKYASLALLKQAKAEIERLRQGPMSDGQLVQRAMRLRRVRTYWWIAWVKEPEAQNGLGCVVFLSHTPQTAVALCAEFYGYEPPAIPPGAA